MTIRHASSRRTRLNDTTISGLGIILGSLILGLFTSARLPEDIRIRWHVGTYEHWGPALVSGDLLAVALPGFLFVTFVTSRLFSRHIKSQEGQRAFDPVVLAIMGGILFVQALLIGLNLVIAS